jgi:hypothetical protein
MTQMDGDPLAEVAATFHTGHGKVIHINPKSYPSGINRSQFDDFRERYWMHRAQDFEGK